GSQSAIVIEARNASGGPMSGLPMRLDILVSGTNQDCGTLTRNVVTGSDGRAIAVYTAPTLPLPLPQCANVGGGSIVTIQATPSGSNFQNSNTRSADIRLTSPGVILPPAGSPTAAFNYSPTPVLAGSSVGFDASASLPGAGASQITSYNWSFGDGGNAV